MSGKNNLLFFFHLKNLKEWLYTRNPSVNPVNNIAKIFSVKGFMVKLQESIDHSSRGRGKVKWRRCYGLLSGNWCHEFQDQLLLLALGRVGVFKWDWRGFYCHTRLRCSFRDFPFLLLLLNFSPGDNPFRRHSTEAKRLGSQSWVVESRSRFREILVDIATMKTNYHCWSSWHFLSIF